MAPTSGTQGFLRKLWRGGTERIRRWLGLQREESLIRDWGGVLSRSEGVERHLARLGDQLAGGTPHESDFGFFAAMDGEQGLFVDVGANAGQSAVSVRCVNRSLQVLSFEPNPLLEPILRRVRDDLLTGFDYRITGLSDRPASRVLYIPLIDDLLVTPLATLDRSLFERQHFHEQLNALSRNGRYEIEEVAVTLERFDDLGLQPTVVKIDNEEHELPCLEGMTATIEACTPIFMIERNRNSDEVGSVLGTHGYRRFAYDADAGELVPLGALEPVNIFYLHPDHHPAGGRG